MANSYVGTINGVTTTVGQEDLSKLDPGSVVSSSMDANSTGHINPMIEYGNQTGLGGLTNSTWNNMGQAAGLAGTAFNVYDNLWGNKADMYKTQMNAMKQNMANIAEDRANHKAFVGNFGSGVNSALGGGLAASAVKK